MAGLLSLRGSTAALVAAALLSAAVTASAASAKDEAKLHFDAGLALVDNEDYGAAAVEFETSVSLYPTKMGLYNLANCYKALRRYGDAIAAIERLESEFKGKLGNLAREVKALQETVEGIVGRLDVRVDKDGAAILVDGEDAGQSPLAKPLILGPGDHAIDVRLAGFESAPQTVRIVARGRFEVSFILAPAAQAPLAAVVPAADLPPVSTAPAATPAPAPAAAATPPVVPTTTAPVAPPPRDPKKRAARALGWTSVALAIVTGVVAGGAYLGGFINSENFQDSRKSYEKIGDRLDAEGPTPELINDEHRLWSDMKGNAKSGDTLEKVGLGTSIGAGVLLATAITLFVVGREKRERRPAPVAVTAAPNGVALEF